MITAKTQAWFKMSNSKSLIIQLLLTD